MGIGIGPRPTFLQVGYDSLTHFLGQWQSRVTAPLTANLYRCILPVDFIQLAMHDVARTKTKRASSSKIARSRLSTDEARSQSD